MISQWCHIIGFLSHILIACLYREVAGFRVDADVWDHALANVKKTLHA